MSSLLIRGARGAIAAALFASVGAAVAAEPPPPPLMEAKKPAPSCGELPRGSRAFKDCIAAQSRRDTATGAQPTVKPALSTR